MRVTRIQFGEDESPNSVAQRIVYAFSIGNIIKIRDKFFKITGMKTICSVAPDLVVGDNYILVLPIGAPEPAKVEPPPKRVGTVLPPPPVVDEVKPCHICKATDKPTKFTPFCSGVHSFDPPRKDGVLVEPPKEPPSQVSHQAQEEPDGPKTISEVGIRVGQRWKPKDARRKGTFLIVKVDQEYMYSDDGRKVSLSRLHRYERIAS